MDSKDCACIGLAMRSFSIPFGDPSRLLPRNHSSEMRHLRIIVTGCKDTEFSAFMQRVPALGSIDCKRAVDRKLMCTIEADQLESFYDTLRKEAEKAWNNPDDESALAFDSAYFPVSSTVLQPMRQLRGRVAARMSRQMEGLPPARAVPLTVFGPDAEG